MSGVGPRGRRSRAVFESDGEGIISSDDATSDSQGSARKRHRQSNGTSNTSLLSASPHERNAQTAYLSQETLRSRPTRKNHLPGSIVRVKLTDFVTYTSAEFFPGPSLNMVIGPNGTGKSTLVCAICLGLGWPTSTLGRAKEVGEFVKHGAGEAVIEIELAKDGKRFKKNLIVECTIRKDGNKSVFKVNGKPQGKRVVLEVVRSMNIQIDNLCQFLPQDRVVEFAAMTPVELLRSTQRAVATKEMIDTHESLKKHGADRKTVNDSLTVDQQTMAELESRHRLQEADVERMREREQVVQRVAMLEKARPVTSYRIANAQWRKAKDERKEKQESFNALQNEVEPTLRATKAKDLYAKKIDAAVRQRKEVLARAERSADSIDKEFDGLQDQQKGFEAAQTKEKEAYKTKKQDILKLESRLRELKVQLQHQPPEVDTAAFNEQLRAKQRTMGEADRITKTQKQRQRMITEQGRECAGIMRDAKAQLEELDSQSGKQTSKLHALSPETAKLWRWVQENSNAFEKDVYGPPAVSCSLKDPKYADMIESLFQKGLMLSFTAQTKKDFKTLSDVASDQLGLSEVNLKFVPYGMERFQNSISRGDMQRFGFDGLALDFLNGPEPVLAMLCGEVKLHETGIASKDTTPQQFQALQQSNVQFWVTSKSTYRVSRRREYGPNATSTQTKQVRKAVVWTDQPLDQSTKQPVLDKIHDMESQIEGFNAENEEAQTLIAEQRQLYRDCEREYKELQDKKSEQQRAAGEFKALPTKIANQESKVKAMQEDIASFVTRLHDISKQQDEAALARAQKALEYAKAVEALRTAHFSLHEAELLSIEAHSDHSTLESRNKEVKELIDTHRKELEQAEQLVDSTRKDAERSLAEVTKTLSEDEDNSIREFFQTLPKDQTIEELEAEIESEKARLDLMHEGNGNTIREYEQRKRKIDQLNSKLEDEKHALAELDLAITELRSQWEPQLDALVAKISASFSDNMEQIGCAGEVGIHKDDDYDSWAIEIRVKFRENEPLTILNSHRQSGGERAVSTIFYLMSLQSMTPSPFRVVDEINQGMDPKNERLVHKRMVDIACGITSGPSAPGSFAPQNENDDDDDEESAGGGSQYFLITPKLLPDLTYARGMRVLCIASGEYMPEEAKMVDFKRALDIRRALGGGSGPRGAVASPASSLADRSRGRVGVAAAG